jgi:hypothetical protein
MRTETAELPSMEERILIRIGIWPNLEQFAPVVRYLRFG